MTAAIKVTREFLIHNLYEVYMPRLEKSLAMALEPNNNVKACYWNASGEARLIAICYAQLGEPEEALEYFKRAAQYALNYYEDEQFKYQLIDALQYSAIARDQTLRETLAHAVESIIERIQSPVLTPYGHALRMLLLRQDEAALPYSQEIISGAQKNKRWAKGFMEQGEIIRAITQTNAAEFNETLQKFLDLHRGWATRGYLRESMLGLISIPALGLARLAFERGMEIKVASPYLPPFLIT